MPELPDVNAYLCALDTRIVGRTLEKVRVASAFVLRTAQPPTADLQGHVVRELRRIGKRVVIGMNNDLWVVIHLMIAGRLHWRAPGVKLSGRNNLAAFDFAEGSLLLTEAGTKRRASLHVLRGEQALRAMDPGGIEILSSTLDEFQFCTPPNFRRSRSPTNCDTRNGSGYIRQRGRRSKRGFGACARRPSMDFQNESPRFGRTWRCTGVSAKHVRDAAIQFNESATPTAKRITAFAVRREESCWRTAHSRVSWERIGPGRWTNSRRSRNHSNATELPGAMQPSCRAAYVILAPAEAKGIMFAGSQFIRVHHDAATPICQDFPHSPAGRELPGWL